MYEKNNLIINVFKELIKQNIDNKYKIYAFNNVIKKLKNINFNIENVNQIKNLFSEKILNRIQEILSTNTLKELKSVETYNPELLKVFGIGHKIAIKLYKDYNIKNIKDLKKHENILSETIKIGLKYHDKIKNTIERQYIDNILAKLLDCSFEFDLNLHLIICGSYRRLMNVSGDIDVIITHTDYKTLNEIQNSDVLEKFIKFLENKNIIISGFTKSYKTKFMGITSNYYRIDVRFIPYESYYSAILYFTGSKNFNRYIRTVAIKHGYKLNEYGLFLNNIKIDINSEKNIFDILKIKYIKPNKRNF